MFVVGNQGFVRLRVVRITGAESNLTEGKLF
jgi:hypothetical protein